MKLSELIAFVREIADDQVAKYQWTDAFITRALNEGESQACRRARLIVDSSTAEVCRIALRSGKSVYDIDPRVLFVRRVKLSGRDVPLGFARVRDMDENCPGWEDETGEVVGWIPDFSSGKLRFYRAPDNSTQSVNLTVVREPLCQMAAPDSTPEIKPRYHYRLADWALYRMFGQRDSEKYDPDRSLKHLAEFEAEFGPASPAVEEQWIDANFDYGSDLGVF